MKRNPRPIAILIAIVTSITLIAAACGDSTTTVGAPSDNPTTTTSAPDEPLGSGPYPIADISFTIHPDGTDSAATATYQLSCLGDTATVTGDAPASADQMCLALNQPDIRQLLINGPAANQICTEIYGGPNVAVITGTLDDDAIDTTANRINGCAISDWDTTLTDLLPTT